jgi:hypothetical protein
MQLPQKVMALPGTKLGYGVAAVMLIVLVILLVAVWRNATFGGAAASLGGAIFGGAAFGFGGDNFDTEDYSGYGGGYGGGARPIRIMMRPEAFKAIYAKKSGIAARIKRGPFADLTAGTDVEVHRSRPLGDNTEYGNPRAATAHVTKVVEYASYAELVKAVGASAFGDESESATVTTLSDFGMPKPGEKVVAIHIRIDKAIDRDAKPGVAASANRYRAKHAAKHGSGLDDEFDSSDSFDM